MTKDLLVESAIATIVGDPDTIPMSVRHPTKEENNHPRGEVEEKNHHQERGGVEMIIMNEDPHREARDSERKDKSSRSYTKRRHQAHVGEWVSGSESEHHSERSYHSDSEHTQDEGVAGLALMTTNSYDIFDSPNEGIGRCFMAKGPKVSHPSMLISIVMKMIC